MSEPIRIRASSWAELLDCPKRWEEKHLHGKRLPSTAPAMIGTAVHGSTAAYDQSRIDGSGLTVDDTAGVAVDLLKHPDEEVDWRGSSQARAEEIALRVHQKYCTEIAPDQQYEVVEHQLAPMEIRMPSGIVFEITGTLDRIRLNLVGNRGVADVKTGAAAVSPDGDVVIGKHTPQLGAYTLLAEHEFGEMLLPSAIIGLHTGGQARAGIGEVQGAKKAFIGTELEPGLLHYVEQYFVSGLFPPNPGSFLCSERYCPFYNQCSFHG